MNLIRYAAASLKTGFAESAKHPGRWLAFTLLMLFPVANFFASGALLKIFRGEEPALAPAKKSFVQGFLATVINIVYMIIPFVIISIFVISGFAVGVQTEDVGDLLLGIIFGSGLGLGFGIIPLILFSMIALPAVISYARTGSVLSAFNFYDLFDMIRTLGKGKYLLSWVLIVVFYLVLSAVYALVSLIPVAGDFISLGLYIVLLLPVAIFNNTFWTKLF